MKQARISSTVFATASIVTFLSVAERGLGFLYRIVLSRLIGAEGVGLYQIALSLFSVFLTLGTGGIPPTVSRLICKNKAENDLLGERASFSAGATLCLLLTVPAVLIFLLFGKAFGFLFSDERALPVFQILLTGLVFSALYAVIRGYFWGNKRFLTGSLIEIIEEIVMVIVGVLLLQNITSPLDGASKAGYAVVISYLCSFTLASICFFLGGGKLAPPKRALKPLLRSTIPLTGVRVSASLVNSAVAVLLPTMLVRAGATSAESLRIFGVVSGMVLPVLFIPATIVGSLSLVLVPEFAENYYSGKDKKLYNDIERGLIVSCLVACVLLPFFYTLGQDLGALAFSEPLAGEMIMKGCVVLLPMSVTMMTTSILNAMGFEKQTFAFYFLGAGTMLLCILILPAVCGGYAYLFGLGASYIVCALCNLILLAKKCPDFFKERKTKILGVVGTGVLAVLPLSLFGGTIEKILSRFFSAFPATVLAGLILAVATFAVYFFLFKKAKK